jgi:alkanesulfonate monooxygenase SsuD/methylene tetrahydromethanopterin reductase-like flavin-dependent oxidoreductase (luciferase family)
MSNISISFDMRAPDLGTTPARVYSEALAMCEYVDTRGIDYAMVMEHHGAEDGYLPTPFLMGAAIAARTKRMRIQMGAVVLPLHDPVKVADQIAVVDLISNGRAEIVLGAGYVKSEFDMFRRSLTERGKLLDAGVPVILRALSGERFKDEGREIYIRPLSVQKPHPTIFLGGGVPATAKRAARFGVGLYPLTPAIIPMYQEECAKRGRSPGPIVFGIANVHISEDPEMTWSKIEHNVLHVVRSYAKWTEGTTSSSPYAGLDNLESLKKSGIYRVLTPDEAIKLASEADKIGGDLTMAPLFGGMDPDIGWRSIELCLQKVVPRLVKKPLGVAPN